MVYRAVLDAGAIAKWKVPDGMTCHVHEFDAREGPGTRETRTWFQNLTDRQRQELPHQSSTVEKRALGMLPERPANEL